MRIYLFVLTAALALAGCNTIQGVGEDITDAGSALEQAVN